MRLIHKVLVVLGVALALPLGVLGVAASVGMHHIEDDATATATDALARTQERRMDDLVRGRAQAIEAFLAPFQEDVTQLASAWSGITRAGVAYTPALSYDDPGMPGLPAYGRVDPAWGTFADFERLGPACPWCSVPPISTGGVPRDTTGGRRETAPWTVSHSRALVRP